MFGVNQRVPGKSSAIVRRRSLAMIVVIVSPCVLSACTLISDDADDDLFITTTIPAVDDQVRELVDLPDSPLPVFVSQRVELAAALEQGDSTECLTIGEDAGKGLADGDFVSSLDELATNYPTPGATLRGEIAFVVGLLERCAGGQAATTVELARMEEALDRWESLL